MLPTTLPFHFGQRDFDLLWVREREREREGERERNVRELGREGVGFDILFWGKNEEIDVIRAFPSDVPNVKYLAFGIPNTKKALS